MHITYYHTGLLEIYWNYTMRITSWRFSIFFLMNYPAVPKNASRILLTIQHLLTLGKNWQNPLTFETIRRLVTVLYWALNCSDLIGESLPDHLAVLAHHPPGSRRELVYSHQPSVVRGMSAG